MIYSKRSLFNLLTAKNGIRSGIVCFFILTLCLMLPGCPPGEDFNFWEPPASLRQIDADSPVIAISGKDLYSGEDIFVAAWVQGDTTSADKLAYTGHYHFGWGWYFGHNVDNDGEGQATLLRLAAGANGSEFAVWYKISPQGNRIYANRLPNHENYSKWETPQSLTDVVTVLDIAAAADAQGNAIVIWVQADSPNNRLYARRYTPDQGWSAAQTIDDNTGNCKFPRIAADASGNAIVVWQLDTVVSDIYANNFSTAAGWGTAQIISGGSANAVSPEIAMNSSGSAMVVWQQDDGGTYNAYSRYYDSGSGWGTFQLIEAGPTNADSIDVAMDDTGSAVAVWRQSDIYFNRYVPDSGWSGEQLIASGLADNPHIATNAEGKTIVTWNQWDPAAVQVYSRKFSPTTGWEATINLSSEAGSANAPDAEIDSQGHATIIWAQSVALDSGGTTSAVFTYSY